jgi:hypothetical protein
MITHLKGRPCREPGSGSWEGDTSSWDRVTCGGCRQSKKYDRLREEAERKAARRKS